MRKFATDPWASWELATNAVVVRKRATATLACANTVACANPWWISYKRRIILLITYECVRILQISYYSCLLRGFAASRKRIAKTLCRYCFFNDFGASFRIFDQTELKYHLFYKVSGIDFPSLEKVDFPLVL